MTKILIQVYVVEGVSVDKLYRYPKPDHTIMFMDTCSLLSEKMIGFYYLSINIFQLCTKYV